MVKQPAWFNVELPDRHNEPHTLFPAEVLAMYSLLSGIVKQYDMLEDERLVKEAKWLAENGRVEHVFLKKGV